MFCRSVAGHEREICAGRPDLFMRRQSLGNCLFAEIHRLALADNDLRFLNY